MYRRAKSVTAVATLISAGLLICLLTSPAFAQDTQQPQTAQPASTAPAVQNGQKVETKGLILTRDGENMVVDTDSLGKLNVVLTPETKVVVPKGIFRHKDMEATSLIPGLNIEFKGTGNDTGQVMAERVEFTNESLKIAKQVHASMTATKAQVEENKQGVATNAQENARQGQAIASNAGEIKEAQQRFDNLTEWDVKKDVKINFATGKSIIPQDSQQELVAMANEAKGLKGYMIEVKGFASTSGDAAKNQQLSEDRAENVVDFLHQQGVPLQHIVNPAAMGTANPVAENETEEGRLQNQRVEVKLLMNRGLQK